MMDFKYKIVLASQSPRRKQLLSELGWKFEIRAKSTDESYPENLKGEEISNYLAEKKANEFVNEIGKDELIITADTIVWIENVMLAKPEDAKEAERMLKLLSGKKHEVYTGVCLMSSEKRKVFSVKTEVFFKNLSDDEIQYYIKNYKPFDKAGSYGAQDWLGLIGVEKINGSYFNVMGLPVKELYEELLKF